MLAWMMVIRALVVAFATIRKIAFASASMDFIRTFTPIQRSNSLSRIEFIETTRLWTDARWSRAPCSTPARRSDARAGRRQKYSRRRTTIAKHPQWRYSDRTWLDLKRNARRPSFLLARTVYPGSMEARHEFIEQMSMSNEMLRGSGNSYCWR